MKYWRSINGVAALLVGTLLLSDQAYAAAGEPPNFESLLSTTLNALHRAGAALAPTLVLLGQQMFAVFFTIMFVWAIIEGTMAGNLEQMFKKMFNQLMIAGIVFEILSGWADKSGVDVFDFVTTGMNGLSTPFSAAGDPSDKVVAVYWKAIQSIYGILNGLLSDLSVHNIMGGWENMIKNAIGLGGKGIGPLTFLFLAVLVVLTVLLCVSILVMAMVYTLLYTNMGDFIIYIGMAVGPVFVATLIFPPVSHYFNKWLEFVISGGIYKLIAVVMGSLLAGVFASVGAAGAQIVTMTSSGWWWNSVGVVFNFVLYALVLIFWCLFAYFMTKQIPMFAHALAGGVNLHMGSLSAMLPAHLSNIKSSSAKGSSGENGGGNGGNGDGEGSGGSGGGGGGEDGIDPAESRKYREMTKGELANNLHKAGAAQEFRDRMHKIKRQKALDSMKGDAAHDAAHDAGHDESEDAMDDAEDEPV